MAAPCSDVHPAELGAVAVRAALADAGVTVEDVDEVVIGHARQAGSGPNPGRQVGRRAGVPDRVPAHTVNKACASGLEAIAHGAQGHRARARPTSSSPAASSR